jgi:hypothetical protein
VISANSGEREPEKDKLGKLKGSGGGGGRNGWKRQEKYESIFAWQKRR